MATVPDAKAKTQYVDKAKVREAFDKALATLGVVYDPTVTAEEVQESLRASGIRPEDNSFSRGIIAMREE